MLETIEDTNSLEELDGIRVKLFGKKGSLAGEFAKLKDIPPKEKKAFAEGLNKKKASLQKVFDTQYEILKEKR